METMFFGIKRVHLCVQKILKKVLRPSILTPAQFDMLRIVGLRKGLWQRTLWHLLGVSRATVSKMLKKLYLHGCITREVDPRDRRQRIVLLTPVGEDLLMRAYLAGIDTRVGEQMVKTAIACAPSPDLEDQNIQRSVFAFEDALVKARREFCDPSLVRMPWTTDDLTVMGQRALEPDPRKPEAYEGYFLSTEDDREELTSEQITLLWNPPRGYVPPPPDTLGLLG